MSILKRQREIRKAEKAARKRARRQGLPEEISAEPQPTIRPGELIGATSPDEDDGSADAGEQPQDDEAQ